MTIVQCTIRMAAMRGGFFPSQLTAVRAGAASAKLPTIGRNHF